MIIEIPTQSEADRKWNDGDKSALIEFIAVFGPLENRTDLVEREVYAKLLIAVLEEARHRCCFCGRSGSDMDFHDKEGQIQLAHYECYIKSSPDRDFK